MPNEHSPVLGQCLAHRPILKTLEILKKEYDLE